MNQHTSPRTRCIICDSETTIKNPFSVEHLIPEFLGGGLELKKCICKECNSRMGADFEGRLANNFLITSFRHAHKIQGKGKILKSPFQGDYTHSDGTKFRVTHQNTLEALTRTLEDHSNSRLRIITDEKNTQSIEGIIRKKIHRKTNLETNKKDLTETIKNLMSTASHTTIENPEITINFDINLNDFELFFLKIAFEAQFYFLGDSFLFSKDYAKMANTLKTLELSPDIKIALPLPEEKLLIEIFDPNFHWVHKQNNIIFIKVHPFSGIVYLEDSNTDLTSRTIKFCYKTQAYEEVDLYNQLARDMKKGLFKDLLGTNE